MLEELLKLFKEKPNLGVALKILAKCKQENAPKLGVLLGKYFIKMFPCTPTLLYEFGILLILAQDRKTAFEVFEDILSLRNISQNIISMTLSSQNSCISAVCDGCVYYDRDIVNKIVNKPENQDPLITFTITTCKRYDLFEKTINSFLNCCTDLEKIDKWFCVDDNSSEEDRKKMKEKYPFFQFYFKTLQEKGHPQSMNIIRKHVDTPYIFHMEDDWKFFVKKPYIGECLEILNFSDNIGQCLVNKNYAEVEKDIGIVGGIQKTTHSGLRFILHEHCSTPQQQALFNKKYNYPLNCAYWPHFSFRPSLFKAFILSELGEFNEKISHFELDYSYKFRNAGYVSAFLESIYCLHIGRLTSQRHDLTKANAYSLNDEKQFSGKENNGDMERSGAMERSGDMESKERSQDPGENKKDIIKTYVINLDRRPDRWDTFRKHPEPEFLCYTRYPAVDGSKLVPTEQLQRIFDGNNYNMREGIVGCAMSHIEMYIELLNSEHDTFCILEDDLEFVPNFKEKFIFLYQNLPDNWDLCYLGHHIWQRYKTPDFFDKTAMPKLEKWNTETSLKISMGGTGGYLISKQGARKLLEFINSRGMTNGIDTIQQKSADFLNVYYCKPHLIYSECCTSEVQTDTDIQYNFKSLTIPLETRLRNQKELYSKRTILETTEIEKVQNYLDSPPKNSVLFYQGDSKNVKELAKSCPLPCYTLGDSVLIVIPDPEKDVLIERLKRDGKYDISEALTFKSLKIIPFSNMTHVYEAIRENLIGNESYPFDTINEGDFETLVSITEKVLKTETEEFVKDLCSVKKHRLTPNYNGKMILKNIEYGISFPHEDLDKLVSIYTNRFKNFKSAIQSGEQVVFIFCSRYELCSEKTLEKFMDIILPCNPNIKIFCINCLEKVPEKYAKYVFLKKLEFPEKFQVAGWPDEKIAYDQKVFRVQLGPLIRGILLESFR